MFSKVLIANRGEIACRIVETCRRRGIATVAVYSDADAGARHVALADEAVAIGPAAAAESYLRGDAVIAAAQTTGAQAIHPGYGFLSENPDFVAAVEAAGLTFVGPSAKAIRAMGLKDRAKALMAEAGVPVVPGYHGADQDDAHLAAQADAIGYPVLIKAVAGGGGKGMRRVDAAADFSAALAAARNEARAAFGNDAVLIEKFIANPRHIEVQVFGDGSRALHLFERDCSLQRRHQKVIEEAPAPGMTEAVRAAMGAAAVRAAEAIGYAGAGTVEFIADGSGALRTDGFWFMEMNTRLQVEHPVTEEITGIDLVDWQLQVAAGADLPARQEDLSIRGHAVEARLYAEDAARGFLPATGTLTDLEFPPELRVETGVRAGDTISPYYDPMIAKLVAHGPDRAAAIARLRAGLARLRLAGTITNLGFLTRLLDDADFCAGQVDTGLIDRGMDRLAAEPAPDAEIWALAALAAADLPRPGSDGFALWAPLRHGVALESGGERRVVPLMQPQPGRFQIGDPAVVLDDLTRDGGVWGYVCDGRRRAALVSVAAGTLTVARDGAQHRFTIPDPLVAGVSTTADPNRITAPMPGLVRRVAVSVGQSVSAGDVLVVLEAMKMEHSLKAPRDGVVADAPVAEGAQVADGDLLVALEPQP
ncbi:MAG: biotin carboxylase N-terminal domain-containing protein [Pseudomonadota bacterium]